MVPAISARDLPVASWVFNSAAVIPSAPAITASCLAFCATRAASFATRPASRSASFATLSSASALTIASDWTWVIVPAVTRVASTEVRTSTPPFSGPPIPIPAPFDATGAFLLTDAPGAFWLPFGLEKVTFLVVVLVTVVVLLAASALPPLVIARPDTTTAAIKLLLVFI